VRLSTLRKKDPGIAPGPYLQLSRLRRRRRRKVHSGTDAVLLCFINTDAGGI